MKKIIHKINKNGITIYNSGNTPIYLGSTKKTTNSVKGLKLPQGSSFSMRRTRKQIVVAIPKNGNYRYINIGSDDLPEDTKLSHCSCYCYEICYA